MNHESRIKNILLVFLLLLVACYYTTPLFAANPSDLQVQIEQVRRDREALLEEQKRLQGELEIVNKEAQNITTAVKSLDTTKKKLAADISITQSKITSTNLTIKSLESMMSEKQRQVVIHRHALAETLLALREYDSKPLLLNLLASTKLSDLWGDKIRLENLDQRLSEEIDNLRETRKALTIEKAEKEKAKQQQLSLQGQLSGQKSIVEENQKAKKELLAQTKNKESEYQKMLAENIARQKESEDDLFQLETELRVTLDPSLIPNPKAGILSWPLDIIFVTNPFGTNVGNKRIYKSGFHNGTDFRASVGTPVKAMHNGVVVGTGNTDEYYGCYSYGRWILIDYGIGLTSVYAHLSASLVEKGQEVKTGQIVGYSGGQPRANGSGYSTGPHLHVGLFATQGVEIAQFVTSKGCKQAFVPLAKGVEAYLDPLAYLPLLN